MSHTAPMRRLSIALTVALACLALPAAARAALTPSQFTKIDGIYAAFGAFDDADGATAADRRAARAACRALGTSDAMLSALRRACNTQLDVGQALGRAARCRGRTACIVAVRRVQRAANAYLARSRAADRVVRAARLGAACQRELTRSPRELRYVVRLRDGFAELERALRARSAARARRAQRRLDALRPPDSRSAARQRADYRAACAPPG
jgi:hypothetical protein